MTTTAPDQLFGYDVMDAAGNKIGSVDSVWVDDATNELEFIGLKTGWIFGKNHVIPAADAQITGDTITVPYGEDQIKDAPSFSGDTELSPNDEQTIYDYYGLDRSTAASPTGLTPGQSGTPTAGWTGGTDRRTLQGEGEIDVPVSEEELKVGKRQVEAGKIRLRKVVRTEHEEVPVELKREDVQVERIPASESTNVPSSAFQEKEIEVPVMAEEPVVQKEARVTGQVHVEKNVDTEQETVGDEVRREEVDVQRGAGTGTTTSRWSSDDEGNPDEAGEGPIDRAGDAFESAIGKDL
jgi:uncharacterized protein (TIGR02271 family)